MEKHMYGLFIDYKNDINDIAFNLCQPSLYWFHMANTVRNQVVLLSTLHPTNCLVFNIYVCVYCFFSTTLLLCFENDYEKKENKIWISLTRFSVIHQVHERPERKEIEIFRKLKSFDHVIFCLQFIVFCKTHYFKLILNLKAFPPR